MRIGAVPLLLSPRLKGLNRRVSGSASVGRSLLLAGMGALFWSLLFVMLYRMLVQFRAAEEIGEALALKLLALIFLTFMGVLLLSNVITALSTFFLARDLELVMASPVHPSDIYGSRLLETLTDSSWMVALMLLPILGAYGWVYQGGWLFVVISLVAMAGYLVIPAVVGSLITLVLVSVFPARRARDLLALIALVGMAGLILLIRLLRPEQLADPEGFRSIVQFLAVLNTPSSVWLPSEWAAQAVTATLQGRSLDLFPLLLLLSTAAAFLVLGAWAHTRFYPEGFSRAQEGAELKEGTERRRILERLLGASSVSVRALAAKDIRTFFRDTTQWSQLILLAVLVAVYVYNIRVLPLQTGGELSAVLVNTISFLNLGLAGFVLAAIAARFLFPAVSLEGNTLWLLRSSPLDFRKLIWTKYWIGIVPLLVLSVALTVGTNLLLEVGRGMMILSVGTIVVVTFVIGALALAFGALFPRFDTENAAQISTGFGGLLFMMAAVAYLAVVVFLEGWPVITFLRSSMEGGGANWHLPTLLLGVGAALAVSVVVGVGALTVAVRRMDTLEA